VLAHSAVSLERQSRAPGPKQDAFMSQAADLVQSSTDLDAVIKAAELLTDLVEDEDGATLYTFDDDSVMLVVGAVATAHDDIAAARHVLGI